jgi:seryl-tRNA synthetase
MTPAACYPLYATATGVLPRQGRTVDVRAFVFRHEPSSDPARMQIFRQREYVRLGTPEQALAHRDDWLARGEALLRALGLDARPVVANDPFFGDAGRLMGASQREQTLKYELVVPLTSAERPTAVASSNYHLDHFGGTFGIRTPDGAPAHTACIGFGLERITLALLRVHGFDPVRWPQPVREVLAL